MGTVKRKIGDRWTIIKRGVAYVKTKRDDGRIVTLERTTPYKDKSKISRNVGSNMSELKKKAHLSDGMRNNGKNDMDGCRKKGDKNFKTKDHSFNPLIHKMVLHESGKYFVQKLRSEL